MIQKKFANLPYFFITDSRGLRHGKMVHNLRYIDRTCDILINTFLPGQLLDSWSIAGEWGFPLTTLLATTKDPHTIEILSRKIMLIGNKTHFPKILLHDHQPVFTTRSYDVFDTEARLADVVQGENLIENMQHIYVKLHEEY